MKILSRDEGLLLFVSRLLFGILFGSLGCGRGLFLQTITSALFSSFFLAIPFPQGLSGLGTGRVIADNPPPQVVLFQKASAAGLDGLDEFLGNLVLRATLCGTLEVFLPALQDGLAECEIAGMNRT